MQLTEMYQKGFSLTAGILSAMVIIPAGMFVVGAAAVTGWGKVMDVSLTNEYKEWSYCWSSSLGKRDWQAVCGQQPKRFKWQ